MDEKASLDRELAAIDNEIEDITGAVTDDLKNRLFDFAVGFVALNHLLFNKTPRTLPFRMPSARAQEFRDKVKDFMNGEVCVARRLCALRERRKKLSNKG